MKQSLRYTRKLMTLQYSDSREKKAYAQQDSELVQTAYLLNNHKVQLRCNVVHWKYMATVIQSVFRTYFMLCMELLLQNMMCVLIDGRWRTTAGGDTVPHSS